MTRTLPEPVDGRSWALAGLLLSSGVVHLVRPQVFDPLIPRSLPGHARTWTYGSGVAELLVSSLIAVPGTRRLGATAAAALFVAVFPGNVTMTMDAFRHRTAPARRAISVLRLPLQIPLVVWAWRVRAAAR